MNHVLINMQTRLLFVKTLSIYLLSIYLSLYLSIYLYICLFIYLSIYLSIYPGFQHMVQLHSAPEPNEKYFSVDASFLSGKSELKTNLRSNPAPQPTLEQVKPPTLKKPDFFAPPPLPPYQRPPPPKPESNLTSTKPISGSVSWLEWTQQLQVNQTLQTKNIKWLSDLKLQTNKNSEIILLFSDLKYKLRNNLNYLTSNLCSLV